MSLDFAFKALNSAHSAIIRLSGGKLGKKIFSMPVITLITIGRSTGQPRKVLLTSPVQSGSNWILIASKGGAKDHPQWYRNLKVNPRVEAILPQDKEPVKFLARDATAEEYPDFWKQTVKTYRQYASYQKKTERTIPIVVLEPQSI